MKNWSIILSCVVIWGCSSSKNSPVKSNHLQYHERLSGSKTLSPGIPAYKESIIDYKRTNKDVLSISFKEPVVVSVASKPEKWGFFQFPNISKTVDNKVNVRWKMNADAMEAYGEPQFGAAASEDGGRSWKPIEQSAYPDILVLDNGDRIGIHTPKPIKVEDLQLAQPIGSTMDTYSRSSSTFYRLHDLPEARQGVFLNRMKKGETEWKVEKATLHDPHAARYSLRGQMPVVWWGDMRQLNDGSIIAGVYPGFLIGSDGKVDPMSGVFFYKSEDRGHSWKIHGRIPYVPDLLADSSGNNRMGFTEPAFEILHDGTFICVLRTTDGIGNGPMYISRSTDQGVNWTKPEVMAPSGVLPQLLKLKNGTMVLSSGRPGVQLRFSTDGKAWTDPIEMMPWEDYKDQVSCGYTSVLETGVDRILVAYSDFKFLNEAREPRKAIKVREVVVALKYEY